MIVQDGTGDGAGAGALSEPLLLRGKSEWSKKLLDNWCAVPPRRPPTPHPRRTHAAPTPQVIRSWWPDPTHNTPPASSPIPYPTGSRILLLQIRSPLRHHP